MAIKSLEDMLLGPEAQEAVHEAVRAAVARAEKAGLPRAYLSEELTLHERLPLEGPPEKSR